MENLSFLELLPAFLAGIILLVIVQYFAGWMQAKLFGEEIVPHIEDEHGRKINLGDPIEFEYKGSLQKGTLVSFQIPSTRSKSFKMVVKARGGAEFPLDPIKDKWSKI